MLERVAYRYYGNHVFGDHVHRADVVIGRFTQRPCVDIASRRSVTWLDTTTGDGCLTMSAPDLAIYLRVLLYRGQVDDEMQILTDNQIEQFTGPHTDETPKPTYGFGSSRITTDTTDSVDHCGGVVGYVSDMKCDHVSDNSVVVLSNTYDSLDRLRANQIPDSRRGLVGHYRNDNP